MKEKSIIGITMGDPAGDGRSDQSDGYQSSLQSSSPFGGVCLSRANGNLYGFNG